MVLKFDLSDQEQKSFNEFCEIHREKCGKKFRWNITFTPTGIGTAVGVKCLCCNEVENITDYESW